MLIKEIALNHPPTTTSQNSLTNADISPGWRYAVVALVLIAAAYGLWQAVSMAWCCDDAFISFRYAKNLVDGHGLVYNVGERVEGYTNFLWTVLIAGGIRLGLNAVWLSQLLSLACYIITVLVLLHTSRWIQASDRSRPILIVPIAALAVLVHHEMHVYATSGLETAMATLLVTLGYIALLRAESARGFLLSGSILALAAMTRPDAMILALAAIVYVVLRKNAGFRQIGMYLLPLVVIYLPYWLIRFAYYGYPFPNSYYAKSASIPYYSQGFTYVWLYLKTYYVLLLLVPALILAAFLLGRKLLNKSRIDTPSDRVRLLSLLCIIPFLLYVTRVGGDFMFARFLIPITPICFLALETELLCYVKRPLLRLGLAILLVLTVFFRWHQFDPPDTAVHGIIDESIAYPPSMVEQARDEGAKIKRFLSGLDVSAAYYGTKAMLVYYAEIPYAMEAASSLTDTVYAHRPITKRGRPGHEKRIPFEYLVERKINFVVGGTFRPTPDPSQPEVISFDGAICHIVVYENEVMDALAKYPEVEFVHFPTFLDRYIEQLDNIPRYQIAEDLRFFQRYYFAHNDDRQHFEAITSRLR